MLESVGKKLRLSWAVELPVPNDECVVVFDQLAGERALEVVDGAESDRAEVGFDEDDEYPGESDECEDDADDADPHCDENWEPSEGCEDLAPVDDDGHRCGFDDLVAVGEDLQGENADDGSEKFDVEANDDDDRQRYEDVSDQRGGEFDDADELHEQSRCRGRINGLRSLSPHVGALLGRMDSRYTLEIDKMSR